ncbi:hypothetical protein [uncultured Flavobacterium sp.]|uniref:hypothetical protein n=1 Tax=uncultured Flavobacterium sp. TaxID=165435 RepID=UPI0030CA2EF0
MTTKTIVISGINMVEGGIFTILDNCLQKISKYAAKNNLNVIALVHDASKFNYPNIEYISFPKSKKNWLFRIYYEYFYFKKLSKKTKPDIWLSLHDVSPNVVAQKRFVYCHHPTVFYKASLKDWKFDYKIGIFSILYKYLFKLNIKKNNAIFVQQHWIKKEFEQLFNINNIIVSKPEFIEENIDFTVTLDNSKIHFFYPTLSKSFKNIEQIAEAILLVSINVLKKINGNGKTIIMAIHDYALIMKFPSKTLKCEDSSVFEVIQRTV